MIAGDVFGALTGLPAESVDGWFASGVLTRRALDVSGRSCYLASELICALVRLGRPGAPVRVRGEGSARVGRIPGPVR